MYVSISIHHPKAGAEQPLIESMHRFGEAIKGAPGLVGVYTLRDEQAGILMGLAIWESQDLMMASVHLAREAVKDDPFDDWESQEIYGYRLTEV